MEFCDECGSMMHSGEGQTDWVCRSCGATKGRDKAEEESMTTTEGQSDGGVVDMSEVDDAEIGPTTEVVCPNDDCDSTRARYQMKQLRSADESETRFFTCVECGKNWREDDH
jgi:DNA-directed RNA polymerase subunit M